LLKVTLARLGRFSMQNIELQILWLSDSLGLAVNQKTSKGSLPITPYYFWPVSEAWEQIRFELDSKPWISEEESTQLLNLIVEVMNQWQQFRTISDTASLPPKKVTVPNYTKLIGLP